MARLRYNGLVAELGGSGLTNSATSVTFATALTHSGGTNVPTISGSDYIPLTILDSDGVPKEIVYLTAYTAAATTGTISRSQEGTSGVTHAAGVAIVHGPTVTDVAKTIGASAYLSSAQNTSTGTGLMVPLQSETFDSDAFHDTVTNNTRMTIPAGGDGMYVVSGQVTYASNVTGYRSAIITKNGATTGPQAVVPGVGSQRALATTILSLVAGDYIELRAFQDSGSTLALDTTGLTFLAIARISS